APAVLRWKVDRRCVDTARRTRRQRRPAIRLLVWCIKKRAQVSADASYAYGSRGFRSVVSGQTRRMPLDGLHRRIGAEVAFRRPLLEFQITDARTLVRLCGRAQRRRYE